MKARWRSSSLADSSFRLASDSELRMRASRMEVNSVMVSSATDEKATTVPSWVPASAPALRHTESSGKLAAAMPV